MLNAGMLTEHVARHVGYSSQAIRKLHIRFRTTVSTNDLRGRPHVTTHGQDCLIMNTHLRNRLQTATATAANTPGLHNNQISAQTVCNRLWENGLHARRPYIGCVLTQHHRQNCPNWARVHARWIWRHWNTVLFSDESRSSLQRGDGKVCMYRRRNERYADCCVLERDRFGGGRSVMVWAAIAHGYCSPLVVIDGNLNTQRYRDDILAHHVIPLFHTNANISVFQHDNASSHTARDIVIIFRTNNIDFIDDWPTNSPDQAEINNLVNSMQQRCTAVVNSRGGHTRY